MMRRKCCLREEKGFSKQRGDNQVVDNNVGKKEEKLLKAIGDLPEDMIAEAANYQCPKRGTGRQRKWYQSGKGLAFAACISLAVLGAAPWFYNIYISGSEQTRTERELVEEQGSSTATNELPSTGKQGEGEKKEKSQTSDIQKESDSTEIMLEDKAAKGEGKTKRGIQLWANVEPESSKKTKGREKEYVKKKMKAGKTMQLQVKETEGDEGEDILVVSFMIGETGDDIKYTLHSELSNCRIVSVTSEGLTKLSDLQTADCMGGDEIELNTFQRAMASWAVNPVPEWSGAGIDVLDIITITGGKEDEEYKFGRIAIGKKGEEYYGVYQREED